MVRKWDALFEQAFADLPDERVVQEARRVLEAMGYEVKMARPTLSPVTYCWRSSTGLCIATSGYVRGVFWPLKSRWAPISLLRACSTGLVSMVSCVWNLDWMALSRTTFSSSLLFWHRQRWNGSTSKRRWRTLLRKDQHDTRRKRGRRIHDTQRTFGSGWDFRE